jgi:hypothetical protein
MKKAQVGLTITWFVAFIVIFFIIILFFLLSGLMSSKKNISPEIIQSSDELGELKNQIALVKILNDPNIYNSIINILMPFINDEEIKYMDKIPFAKIKIDERKQEITQIQNQINCSDYVLKLPIAFIYSLEGEKNFEFISPKIPEELNKQLGKMAYITIPYKNREIEIGLQTKC